MSMLVLPRLYAGGAPLVRAFGTVVITFGVWLIATAVRGVIDPLPTGYDSTAVTAGSIAFLGAGMLAALLAAAAWELQSCPFAWNTPGLTRRIRQEILFGGFVVFALAMGVGVAVQGTIESSIWLFGTASALGYAVGLLNNLNSAAWSRFGGIVGILSAMLPVYFMPEIAQIPLYAGFLLLLLAITAMAVTIKRASSLLLKCEGRLDGDCAGAGALGIVASAQWRAHAPRDGADRFVGTRRSDLDWVRALLHETCGSSRGGLAMSSVRLGVAAALYLLISQVFLGIVANCNATDESSGTPAIAASGQVSDGQLGMGGVNLARMFESRGSLSDPVAVNIAACVLLILVATRRALPILGALYPLSRSRVARITWLRTQVEEVAALLGIVGVFLMSAVLLDQLTEQDPWPIFARCAVGLVALFTMLPFARWIWLRLVEARRRPRSTDGSAELQDPWAIFVLALCGAVSIGAASQLPRIWTEVATSLRAVGPDALEPLSLLVVTLLVLVPIVALRLLWLIALRRFYERRDLVSG